MVDRRTCGTVAGDNQPLLHGHLAPRKLHRPLEPQQGRSFKEGEVVGSKARQRGGVDLPRCQRQLRKRAQSRRVAHQSEQDPSPWRPRFGGRGANLDGPPS